MGEYRSLGPILDKRTGALGFGGRIHTALELWGSGEVETPAEAWHALMHHEYAIAAERGWDVVELDKEAALGLVMLETLPPWLESEGEDQEYETVVVEQKVSDLLHVDTPAGEPVDIWLYGKLDRVLRHREFGTLLVADWKTTRSLEDAFKDSVEQSPQPRIYQALLAQELPGENIVGVRYTALRKVLQTARAKPPFIFNYDLMMSEYNVGQHMERVRAHVGRMVETKNTLDLGVPHSVAAPFNPTWQCKSCVFKNVCWTMQTTGMDAAEDMLADQFTVVDPMERYKEDVEETVEAG